MNLQIIANYLVCKKFNFFNQNDKMPRNCQLNDIIHIVIYLIDIFIPYKTTKESIRYLIDKMQAEVRLTEKSVKFLQAISSIQTILIFYSTLNKLPLRLPTSRVHYFVFKNSEILI